jgi:hypothetical protein
VKVSEGESKRVSRSAGADIGMYYRRARRVPGSNTRDTPLPLRPCHYTPATTRLPLRPCHYALATTRLPLRPCHYAPVDSAAGVFAGPV